MNSDNINTLKTKLVRGNFFGCEIDYAGKFKEIADILLYGTSIQKGGRKYRITDIEFYWYSDEHRDIITYPRTCDAGMWFFHASGVDLSFESKVEMKPKLTSKDKHLAPNLNKDSYFGGILIRGIHSLDDDRKIDGPFKVVDELFDKFNAFGIGTADFPILVEDKHDVESGCEPSKRVNLNPDAEKKVKSIMSYNYSGSDIEELQLIDSYSLYRIKPYRFTL